ncbi:hypothetical protein A0H81_02488 [Grifola frondosa]|uniref:Uncharacterized protein n=1 Tax=Grifola frondosa TaxID=5627 RepID=A0A1C7MMY1_GRIFR|nr:hypothetical protein A0H81_02488 [Grifola frondosa]
MSASDTDINLRGPNRTLSGCEDGEFDRLYINIDDKYLEDRYLKAKFCYQYGFFVPIMLFAFGAMALVQPQVELNAWEMTLPESQRRKLLIRLRLLELKTLTRILHIIMGIWSRFISTRAREITDYLDRDIIIHASGIADIDVNLRAGPNSGSDASASDDELNQLYMNVEGREVLAQYYYEYGLFTPLVLSAWGAWCLISPQVKLNAWELSLPEPQRQELLIRLRLLERKWATKCFYLFLVQTTVAVLLLLVAARLVEYRLLLVQAN